MTTSTTNEGVRVEKEGKEERGRRKTITGETGGENKRRRSEEGLIRGERAGASGNDQHEKEPSRSRPNRAASEKTAGESLRRRSLVGPSSGPGFSCVIIFISYFYFYSILLSLLFCGHEQKKGRRLEE